MIIAGLPLIGQTYTSYFTGNPANIVTSPSGGVCLMGGATENDNAMRWFLQRANGGDVLVIRTSGSNGYNSYMYSSLGVTLNSVETIVFKSPAACYEPYVRQKISQAEAIWIAGGDQWNYISYWRNTPVDSLINLAISQRNIVIGGTSAGMAVLGKYYFSAKNGTVTSSTALSNPYHAYVTVDSAGFFSVPFLNNVITDTHYDNPDRKGRHVVFLARILKDYGVAAKGIACDEYTAVCIDSYGNASVYGGYPAYNDNAYFIQTNCELPDITPENCSAGVPLTWNLGGQSLKVYAVKGTQNGSNTFNLNDWRTGTGGTWQNWSVNNGILSEQPGAQINCPPLSVKETRNSSFLRVFPNPAKDFVKIHSGNSELDGGRIEIFNTLGQRIKTEKIINSSGEINLNVRNLSKGLYILRLNLNGRQYMNTKLLIE